MKSKLIKSDDLRPINDRILVTNMEFGEKKTKFGIIISSDDGKDHGIRPRWCKVLKIGKKQKEIKVGDYLLVAHGRWSRAFILKDKKIFMLDYPKGILLISKTRPVELDLIDG